MRRKHKKGARMKRRKLKLEIKVRESNRKGHPESLELLPGTAAGNSSVFSFLAPGRGTQTPFASCSERELGFLR